MRRLPLLLACIAVAAEAGAAHRGMPLERALQELRAGGLHLLYSSDLIKPWMRVEREPRAIDPQALLAEIVVPHGIAVARGPGDTPDARARAAARSAASQSGCDAPAGARADRRRRRQREPLPLRPGQSG